MTSITSTQLEVLRELIVEHPRFSEVKETIFDHIAQGERDSILVCVGPSGAGKTTLIDHIVIEVDKNANGVWPRGRVIVVRAPVPKGTPFQWRTFYVDTLAVLGEVGANDKVSLQGNTEPLSWAKNSVRRARIANIDELGKVMETALDDRCPAALVVDECQHIGASKSGRVKAGNLDVVKDHKANLNTPIVLVGTYEAEEMLHYSGQISRRVQLVRFRPYYPEQKDVNVFRAIVSHMIDKADIPISFSLEKHVWDLHKYSCGCVGIMANLLYDATYRAQKLAKRQVTLEDINAKRRNDAALRALSLEIQRYDAERWRGYSLDLGRGTHASRGNSTSRKRPGTRNPHRYPTAEGASE